MPRRILLTAITLLGATTAAAVAPAYGANQEVILGHDEFIPKKVAVLPGESVLWENEDNHEDHNVHFEDESFIDPDSSRVGPWATGRTFSQAGVSPTTARYTAHLGASACPARCMRERDEIVVSWVPAHREVWGRWVGGHGRDRGEVGDEPLCLRKREVAPQSGTAEH